MLVQVLLTMPSDPAGESRFKQILQRSNALVSRLDQGAELWERLALAPFDLVVVERSLVDSSAGLVADIRRLPDSPEVIVLSDREDARARTQLLAAGCLAVLHTRLDDDLLSDAFAALLNRRRDEGLRRIEVEQSAELHRLGDFVSASPAMQQLMSVARRVAASDTSLIITGETGVGKEWLARAIHEEGPRSTGPFIAVNCGAIPETLLESELFGHEAGAFTGAKRAHRGYFEVAHGGTVFLDEISEMAHSMQVRFLRVLQERHIRRLGSERDIAVNVRVVAATNRDLEREIAEERFRTDLYYRLGVVTLEVPPLRDRREDIPDLLQSYLQVFRLRLGRAISDFKPDAKRALVAYGWPGNVRELINVVERAVLLSEDEEIGMEDLPETIARIGGTAAAPETGLAQHAVGFNPDWLTMPLRDARRELLLAFEHRYLVEVLEETRGRVGDAAHRAGITARSLFDKMQQHGLRKEDYKR